jgi:hypothetical protein
VGHPEEEMRGYYTSKYANSNVCLIARARIGKLWHEQASFHDGQLFADDWITIAANAVQTDLTSVHVEHSIESIEPVPGNGPILPHSPC